MFSLLALLTVLKKYRRAPRGFVMRGACVRRYVFNYPERVSYIPIKALTLLTAITAGRLAGPRSRALASPSVRIAQNSKFRSVYGDNSGTPVLFPFIFLLLETRSGLENRCSTRRNDYK